MCPATGSSHQGVGQRLISTSTDAGHVSRCPNPDIESLAEFYRHGRIDELSVPQGYRIGSLLQRRSWRWEHNVFNEYIVPLHDNSITITGVGSMPNLHVDGFCGTIKLVLRTVVVLINPFQNFGNGVNGESDLCRKHLCFFRGEMLSS